MKATVTHGEDGKVTSFIVNGERSRWFWQMNDGTATFTRVEVDKDDHSTDSAVVLFSGELDDAMSYAQSLPFVTDTEWQASLEER